MKSEGAAGSFTSGGSGGPFLPHAAQDKDKTINAEIAEKIVTIDEAYVTKMLADIVKNEDLSRYIL